MKRQRGVYGPRCDYHEITLRGAGGRELASSRGSYETVAHLRHRQRGPGRLYATGRLRSKLRSDRRELRKSSAAVSAYCSR